jgi:hypothetical protein
MRRDALRLVADTEHGTVQTNTTPATTVLHRIGDEVDVPASLVERTEESSFPDDAA